MDRFSAGAMEMDTDPVPPVPPDLDLDLDLEIDFDDLPEIEIPDEIESEPPQPKSPAPSGAATFEDAPRRRPQTGTRSATEPGPQGRLGASEGSQPEPSSRSWWPFLGGVLALLLVALAAVPFAILRLNDMSRDMSLLSDRVEQAEAENAKMTDTLAREAIDAVSMHLADTERRIERVRGALDEVRRGASTTAAATPKEEPKPVQATEKASVLPEPKPAQVAEKAPALPEPKVPSAPAVAADAELLPPPPDLEERKGGPLVGVSKKPKPEPIAPAAAVRAAPAPPVPVSKGEPKVEQPATSKQPSEPAGSGRILLPTELYDENEE